MNESSTSSAHNGKRKRAAIACERCRFRKVRCIAEEGLPCYNCQTDGVSCGLPEDRRRLPRKPKITSPTDEDNNKITGMKSLENNLATHQESNAESTSSLRSIEFDHSGPFHKGHALSGDVGKLSEMPPKLAPIVGAETLTPWVIDCPVPLSPNSVTEILSICFKESIDSQKKTTRQFFDTTSGITSRQSMSPPPGREHSGTKKGFGSQHNGKGGGRCQSQSLTEVSAIDFKEITTRCHDLLGLASKLSTAVLNLSHIPKSSCTFHNGCRCQTHTAQVSNSLNYKGIVDYAQQDVESSPEMNKLDICLSQPDNMMSAAEPKDFNDEEQHELGTDSLMSLINGVGN